MNQEHAEELKELEARARAARQKLARLTEVLGNATRVLAEPSQAPDALPGRPPATQRELEAE